MQKLTKEQIISRVLKVKELDFLPEDILEVIEYQGGLVNYVFQIKTTKGVFFLKQFLEELKADVFKGLAIAPQERIQLSYDVETIFEEILGQESNIIPHIYDYNKIEGYLLIAGLNFDRKLIDEFVGGYFSSWLMIPLAKALAKIHQSTYQNSKKELYNNEWLKLKLKYQYYEMAKLVSGGAGEKIIQLANNYQNTKLVLVHGDLGSINILLENTNKFHLVDFEDAHLGTPAFDLGYLLSEYYIAALYYQNQTKSIKKMMQEFLTAYFSVFNKESRVIVENETTLHLASMLLYRIYGLSKNAFTTYVNDVTRLTVKERVELMLKEDDKPVAYFIEKL
ncbi:MAG: aminoglycoside phosphotransferase family protein [Candidatus Komeilibacteria bacterium]|nr:aminoglycoside phosphotransferase family protein [Candidatus Komeilibacteria bacterium]